ncbi:MAG TPA: DUF2497 domain-containing protein [Micropepsaceae bacterium]|nr:DUF2497 domain-containing protein [Micropepsaceae bacterium]
MSATNTQHEPTMEEILASIRKIISEDQPEPAKPVAPPPLRAVPAAPVAESTEPDVLDLTEEVHDDIAAPQPQPAPAPIPLAAPPENDVVFEAREETKAEPAITHDLISDTTRSALGRSFANLDGDARPSGGSIEAVFTRAIHDAFVATLKEWVDAHHGEILNEMKPMIRSWMDENLPPLIQSAVASELGRLNGARKK